VRSTRIRSRAVSAVGTDEVIGAFRLLRSLGSGATGEVFLAERIESFPQRVAIKVLARGADAEAGILTALDHPHIVRLIDRGTLPHGPAYLVMDYIEGEPLDAYCARRPVTKPERLRLLVKILDALSHAHRHLVIHADLKPANILVSVDLEPTLLDFGVAQWLGHGHGGAPGAQPGLTPEFASPEQKAGARLTAASDIYSIGLIARALLLDPGSAPSARERDPDLASVLAAATHTHPADRYASADAFKGDLQRILDGRDVSVRRAGPLGGALRWIRRHRFVSATATLILLTAAIAIGGVVRSAAHAARQRALAESELHELVTLTGTLQGELYDSVGSLAQSAAAKRVLLDGASGTLGALAARDDNDPILTAELGRQYLKLARLQWAAVDTADDPALARRSARAAADAGIRLLRQIGSTDPAYAQAQRDLTALRALPIDTGS
jgi:hypothetical protein